MDFYNRGYSDLMILVINISKCIISKISDDKHQIKCFILYFLKTIFNINYFNKYVIYSFKY